MHFAIVVNKEDIDCLDSKTVLRFEQLFGIGILEMDGVVVSRVGHGRLQEHTIRYNITQSFNVQNLQMHYTGNMPIGYVTVLMALAQGHDVDLALDGVEAGVGGFV